MSEDPRAPIATWLRFQEAACRELGSPLYAELLRRSALDAEAGGPVWDVLRGYAADPGESALGLRFMGALHRLVLEGKAPRLAAYFPSVGGTAPAEKAFDALLHTLSERFDDVQAGAARPVQTNEVGRSGALIGGFLMLARETGLPLRHLEVGASAGLNLRWDRFLYRCGATAWGDRSSPVDLDDPFHDGPGPDLSAPAEVAVVERAGCDPHPVDPASEEGRLTLLSYVWADQQRRFRDLAGAIEIARRVPATVVRAGAPEFITDRLAARQPGTATVVTHTIVMRYLTDEDRESFRAALDEAADRATADAPLAWLRMEPRPGSLAGGEPDAVLAMEVRLTTWPGGTERLLATAGAHGRPVRWLV